MRGRDWCGTRRQRGVPAITLRDALVFLPRVARARAHRRSRDVNTFTRRPVDGAARFRAAAEGRCPTEATSAAAAAHADRASAAGAPPGKEHGRRPRPDHSFPLSRARILLRSGHDRPRLCRRAHGLLVPSATRVVTRGRRHPADDPTALGQAREPGVMRALHAPLRIHAQCVYSPGAASVRAGSVSMSAHGRRGPLLLGCARLCAAGGRAPPCLHEKDAGCCNSATTPQMFWMLPFRKSFRVNSVNLAFLGIPGTKRGVPSPATGSEAKD